MHRNVYPNSWWWTAELDLLSAVLNAVQWGNWQRSGGRGDKPKPIRRPKEQSKKGPTTVDELQARKSLVRKQRRKVTDGD